MIVDEATCTNIVDDQYVVYDNIQKLTGIAGVEYLGPEPIPVPTTEYESEISFVQYNKFTYSPIVTLKPMEMDYTGTIYYYSVIGVDETNNMITHLSKVSAILLSSDYQNTGSREILSTNEYTGMPADTWSSVATVDWQTAIQIGDTNNPIAINRFGYPFSDKIPVFNKEQATIETRYAAMFNQITINIPNIWRANNKDYNFRKLKSYKVRNIYDGKYGEFSVPTYQSEMPLSIEKIMILRKNVTGLSEVEKNTPCELNEIGTNVANPLTIIRKNGIYYNSREHGILSANKYSIPPEDTTAIFTESSVQNEITMVFEVEQNKIYNYTFYLFDVYGKKSDPVTILIET
jgi:hypothetical protein